MFLCLSSLGLISLLSFSEFSPFICKWQTSERLVTGCRCWGGRRLKCLFSKPQGSPFEKAPSLSQCFCLYDFELKGWSNSFRRLSCLYNEPSCPIYSLVFLGFKKKKSLSTTLFIILVQEFLKIPWVFDSYCQLILLSSDVYLLLTDKNHKPCAEQFRFASFSKWKYKMPSKIWISEKQLTKFQYKYVPNHWQIMGRSHT